MKTFFLSFTTTTLLGTNRVQAWTPWVVPKSQSIPRVRAMKPEDEDVSRRAFLKVTLTALTTTALVPATPVRAETLPTLGTKAPAFDLPNSRGDGTRTSLRDLTKSGKWTVLYFYPGAFTSGCTLEAKSFQRDINQYRNYNAQIVGVSVDPPEKNAQFCTAAGLDFFMLSDAGGRVSKLYGSALSIPGFGSFSNRQTYIIDPDGNIQWVFTDVESRISRHSQEVLNKLEELTQAVKV